MAKPMCRVIPLLAAASAWPAAAFAQSGAPSGDIVVTGTRTPRTVREAPVRTDIIGETILTATAPRSLADALDWLPGARSESNCQNCNTTEIQLLGLPGAYNQILLDGLPLISGVAAVYGVEQLPAVLIDRIEVVKGGGSALYGPGAVAGVVNVLPIKPLRSGIRATLDYGRLAGENAVTGSAMGSLALGGGGMVSLYGQGARQPGVDLNGDDYTELARLRQWSGGLRGTMAIGGATRAAFDYQFSDERRRGGNMLDRAPHLANIAEAVDSRVHRASLSVERQLAEATTLTAVYALSHVTRDSFYGGLGDVVVDPAANGFDAAALAQAEAVSRRQYGATRDTLHFGELRLAAARGGHDVQLGVQYRGERVDDRNLDADGRFLGTLSKGSFSTLGAFAQDEWSLSGAVRLLLGARIDRSSVLDDAIVSPRVGLWWSPSPAWVVRANWSTGYRAPEIFSEDVHIAVLGADPVRVRNAAGLKPERADSMALGFDWRPGWSSGALTLDGQFYRTTIRDTFFLGEIREDAGGLFQVRDNAGGSTVTGAELNASLRVDERLRLTAGAAWIDARYDGAQRVFDGDERQLFTRRYLKSPRWNAIGQAIWTFSPRLDGFLGVRYVGPMDVLNNRLGAIRRSPAFVVADLSATRHLPVGGDREIDVTLGVRNITDARQRDLETGATRDSDYVYGPRSPRTVFVQARAHF
ncbi:TonB-dependent receptor [uncultured Sphingomonas sp.]|uniref:TonB-dependent receptor plug domain-containing protein n=1 Tax=uncultured Sphingomonas sp. TaxID=158754 RepID=UPI0026203013|nr:TonB-dependent receptor [uncultured Sphingomonas sp.]